MTSHIVRHTRLQSGFTAVELLITLFVASVFLFSGYQLFTQVVRDGADAQRTARLSSRTYDTLRTYTGTVLNRTGAECDSQPVPNGSTEENNTSLPPTTTGGTRITYVGKVTCPFDSATKAVNTYHITVTGTDTGSGKTITHSTYANN